MSNIKDKTQPNVHLKEIDVIVLEEASRVTVKPVSIWNKFVCCFKRSNKKRSDKALQTLRKEKKALQKKEKEREIAEKEWKNYKQVEKISLIVFTIIKVNF